MSDATPCAETTLIRLVIDPGFPPQEELSLKVSPSAADELRLLLQEHGVFTGDAMQHDASHLLVLGGSIAGGLSGIAAVLRVFFSRHDGRKITLVRGDETFMTEGLSPKETEAHVDRYLEDYRRRYCGD